MGMVNLETKARAFIKEDFPGIPAKEKTVLQREIVSRFIKDRCTMGQAFHRVTTEKKDYYAQWDD